MTTLDFKTDIYANPEKVWQVLWDDSTYRKWTSAFHEGSYAVSDWKEGSQIQFLSPDGSGMFSIIAESRPNEHMAFKHLGEMKNFTEQPETEETKAWKGAMEKYTLIQENGGTTLLVSTDSNEEFAGYFKDTFPKALSIVKELAENPISITVEALVETSIEKVWQFWTSPEHIIKWNNASDDWYTPYAENDLQVGGKFLSRMAAKDGSFSFDFVGTYEEVKTYELIASTLGDDRKVKVTFTNEGNATKVTETFEAETENSIELQRGGWQAILDNFKKYAESN